MAVQLSVIVPCLNEEESMPLLVERMEPVISGVFAGNAELIAVDDGSTDRTWPVMQELSECYSFLKPHRHGKNRGLSEAWWTGAKAARGETICTLDADLQYRPEEIERLYTARFESGVDIVQGTRIRNDQKFDSRYLLSRGLNSLLNVLFDMSLDDNKSGFLFCGRDCFLDLLEGRHGFRYFQALVMVAAQARGYSYCSLPTPFDKRAAGKSFLGSLPLRVTSGVTVDLCRAFVRYRLRGGL